MTMRSLTFSQSDRLPLPEAAHSNHGAAATDATAFRHAMRELASGVAVIACGEGNERNGCTVTSLTSFSLSPPSLLVCIGLASSTLASLRAYGAFGVSLLAAHHENLADRFAGRDGAVGAQRFEGANWKRLVTGAPLLADAIATFDCRVDDLIERHTHAIVIGAVAAIRKGPATEALVHWRGGYETLA
jgi:flavin reductase (DIM6/NTAB) family NADH-FMN oxidoreductase RutF